VRKIEGIFIADHLIDTACTKDQGGFKSDDSCLPSTSSDALELQGMFYTGVNGKYRLDRVGAPGELFKYRPDLLFAANNQLGKITLLWKETQD
jgi:hypothetical protein